MPEQEKEKMKIRPKKEGDDGPIKDDTSNPSGNESKIDAAKKAGEEAKNMTEKYRKRARERMSQIDKEDVEVKYRDKQRPGE